jgi:glycolate oxidase
MGKLAPDMICMDGTIPRHALPFVLDEMAKLSEKYELGFCNVFHAGDGNLHPLIIFDIMKPGEFERAEAFGADILRLCVKVGGVLSGEHGVGVEKRDLMTDMFTPEELALQGRVKCAFDAQGLFNPGKVFPTLSACVEQGHMHVHGAQLPHPHLPRF